MGTDMTKRRLLLCHPSKSAISEMKGATKNTASQSNFLSASSLTEAYNTVEHDHPDCIILAAELAANPDFELLGYLLAKLRTGCVIWGSGRKIPAQTGDLKMHYFDPKGIAENLDAAIGRATMGRQLNQTRSPFNLPSYAYDPRQILMIGASTGGVDALAKVLSHFSEVSPPTLIVQHTGGRFLRSLIRLIDGVTDASVRPAIVGAPLEPGTVYIAPSDDQHLGVSGKSGQRIALTAAEPMSGHRPSIDMLFRSALAYGPHVTAALLTGMGQDGARGLKALRDAGAHTIAQDQASSVVYGMPRIAAEIGAAAEQLPLAEIGPALLKAARLKMYV